MLISVNIQNQIRCLLLLGDPRWPLLMNFLLHRIDRFEDYARLPWLLRRQLFWNNNWLCWNWLFKKFVAWVKREHRVQLWKSLCQLGCDQTLFHNHLLLVRLYLFTLASSRVFPKFRREARKLNVRFASWRTQLRVLIFLTGVKPVFWRAFFCNESRDRLFFWPRSEISHL